MTSIEHLSIMNLLLSFSKGFNTLRHTKISKFDPPSRKRHYPSYSEQKIAYEGGYSIIVRQTQKNGFSDPPMMSFAFLDMIFGGKGLQIDTYKPPKCIWSYHTHVVNTR